MKVILNAKQVVPNNIRKNYYAADLFLEKVLDAMLLEAASVHMGSSAINQPQLVDAGDGMFKQEDTTPWFKRIIGITLS